MGKPFKSELRSINQVFEWACKLDLSNLTTEIDILKKYPMLVVGSGGSLSACHFVARLHQSLGQIGKAITPLELFYSQNIINKCSLLFLSASGRNTDILTSFKNANQQNPKKLSGITLSVDTPLNKLTSKIGAQSILEFENPIGKDGFLATNSLVAFFVILYRAYGNIIGDEIFNSNDLFQQEVSSFATLVDKDFTFKVLYGNWGMPVAVDIESKFSEAGLGNVLLSDYRNFGHGRHNWIDKRMQSTAIVALITPDDQELAEKTLGLLPREVPVLRIRSTSVDSFSAIELLIKSFYLTSVMGDLQNIDPGRPGVPEYGSKLYHLNYFNLLKKNSNDSSKIAIQRKLGNQSFYQLKPDAQEKWLTSYNNYKKKLNNQKFHAAVFDYDGTLCHASERFNGLNILMGNKLNQFLSNEIVIGVATGRGKSIKNDLRKVIDQKYWGNVVVGYYNGAEIGFLLDDHVPLQNDSINSTLQPLRGILNAHFGDEINLKLKSMQLTIELNHDSSNEFITEIIKFVYLQNIAGLLCVQSDHSIDVIIRPDVSKLNVVNYIKQFSKNKSHEILCFGDKGQFPGNDFELLSHPFSLSVDEVSADSESCWNFSTASTKTTNSTFEYLNKTKIFDGFFKIKI
ncbi:hypothetical protein [Flavobacterium fluviatile]|uniref:hypothetical protein n=1 Tax=Flavobacterium fluviatile TaxID=1862387 RepID=UPI0013D74A73|nr:hypothetical protein [Flavobacterium fluviatile]